MVFRCMNLDRISVVVAIFGQDSFLLDLDLSAFYDLRLQSGHRKLFSSLLLLWSHLDWILIFW